MDDIRVIDNHGFRLNVGIILRNEHNQVFWGRRVGSQDAWQFPQGGIQEGETLTQALYRELEEEVGLLPEHVEIEDISEEWLHYRLPKRFIRYNRQPLCIGQKQKWCLLRLIADESSIALDKGEIPEFSDWRWVDYWYPLDHVVAFKQEVYQKALEAFAGQCKAGE